MDPVLWNDWHPVAARAHHTMLLGVSLIVTDDGVVHRADHVPLHQTGRYGLIWVCLGTPARDVMAIPEAEEPDRPAVIVGAIPVRTSAPRVIENFLDLGHLGYVHAGYLGDDPHTQVLPYKVDPLPEGGVIATQCRMYQPQASPAATEGFVVDYIYKVERPLITCLYKSNSVFRDRFDVIYLFVQTVTPETSIAHPLLLFVADGTSPEALIAFQQTIFLQDKPILENQVPKRLPLGEGAELAIAADRMSVAYRRWLRAIGLTWGVTLLPSPQAEEPGLLDPARWYPIAAEHDVPRQHIHRATLGGHELAVWRSSDGTVHVWQDRCPHRGVHFSLGEVVGDELRCQYHAWRFGTSGACTFIPAQPDRKVPGTIRATVWPVAQSGGMIWTGFDPVGAPPAPAENGQNPMPVAPRDRGIILYDAHHLARGYAVRLLLGYLGQTAEIRPLNVFPGHQDHNEDFLAISPLGTLPVLVDGAHVITEWQEILAHIAQRHAPAWAPHAPALIGWLGIARDLGASAGLARMIDTFGAPGDGEAARGAAEPLLDDIERRMGSAERAGHAWLIPGARPTIADIACFVFIAPCEDGGLSLRTRPALRRWCDRMRFHPGFVAMSGLFPPMANTAT